MFPHFYCIGNQYIRQYPKSGREAPISRHKKQN